MERCKILICSLSSIYFYLFIYFSTHSRASSYVLIFQHFGIKKKKYANNFTEHQKLNHLIRAPVTTWLRAPNYTVEQVNQRASTV